MQASRRRSTRLILYPLLLLLLGCLLLCGIVMLNAATDALSTGEESNLRRLRYGLTLQPSGFDPHLNAAAELSIPFQSVYDTLVYRHPETGQFEPGLAESWEISADRRVYTFFLKEEVYFHDGQLFNASSVGVNFDRITDPDFGSQRARSLLGPYYQGYSIIDESTFQIQLSQPYEALMDGLSQTYLGIASPLALANHSDGTYQWHQVGTGPYRLKNVIPGDQIVLERNPDYAWGPAFYATDNPNPIEEVVFRFYEDPPTRDDALVSGQVDFIGELAPVDVELLLGNSDIRIYPEAIPGQPLQFIFNLQRFPSSDRNVRQALLYGTNRTAIVDAVFAGQSPVAYGPLSAASEFYNAEVEGSYAYNLAEVERLLGLSDIRDSDEDGTLEQDGVPVSLKVIVPPWGSIPQVMQALEDQWTQLGFQVVVEQVPTYPALLEAIAEGDFNLVAEYSFGTDASLLNDYFMTGASKNWASYSDSEVDQWLNQALQADYNTRRSLYEAVQAKLMNDAVILPIRDYVNLNGARNNLDGVIFSASGWSPLLVNFQWDN